MPRGIVQKAVLTSEDLKLRTRLPFSIGNIFLPA
jgi:hypothetical protein